MGYHYLFGNEEFLYVCAMKKEVKNLTYVEEKKNL